MIKKILLGLLIIIVLSCTAGGLYLYSIVNKNIDEHFDGTCNNFEMTGSGEDVQIDRVSQPNVTHLATSHLRMSSEDTVGCPFLYHARHPPDGPATSPSRIRSTASPGP